MACYYPLEGWRSAEKNKNGKRPIVFDYSKAMKDMPVKVPCGQCVGCRLERSRQWAVRCVHEASLHSENCFLTLTYDDDHIPSDGSLCMKHFQDFMKRLRFNSGIKMRYFHCGEYGDTTQRPHYHACIFGYSPSDKKLWRRSCDNPLFISEFLEKTWGHGYVVIGNVTFESAAYVARYIMKKITGDMAQEYYSDIDPQTGEVLNTRLPEYTTMSRRPGIGIGWLEKYSSDVYPHDRVVLRGSKFKPPAAYDRWLEMTDPSLFTQLKNLRKMSARKKESDNTPDRLRVKEQVKLAQISSLKRGLL